MPTKGTAALLGILLGFCGAHQFYLKRYNVGVVWLLASIFLSWTVIVPFALWGIGALQGISYLFWSNENWKDQFIK